MLTARAARLALLCDDLIAERLQAPAPGLAGVLAEAPRAADRVLADYMLRVCEGLLGLTGSAMDGVVLLALCAANIAGLEVERVAGWDRYGALVAPCSATALAQALGMPGETVRRHLHRLSAAGFARHAAKGWIAEAPPDKRAELGRLVEANAQNLRRMLASLTDLAGRSSAEAARRA